MQISQRDYILRIIEQIGAALRRLRAMLVAGAPAELVIEESQRGQAELFGSMWPTIQSLDAATAARLVPDARQLELWVELLKVEADAHRQAGNEARAATLETQADLLAREFAAFEDEVTRRSGE